MATEKKTPMQRAYELLSAKYHQDEKFVTVEAHSIATYDHSLYSVDVPVPLILELKKIHSVPAMKVCAEEMLAHFLTISVMLAKPVKYRS